MMCQDMPTKKENEKQKLRMVYAELLTDLLNRELGVTIDYVKLHSLLNRKFSSIAMLVHEIHEG